MLEEIFNTFLSGWITLLKIQNHKYQKQISEVPIGLLEYRLKTNLVLIRNGNKNKFGLVFLQLIYNELIRAQN